jgi:hypothetical protein
MDRVAISTQLATAERHVIEGQDHIDQQRGIVARLERAGRGNSWTAKLARDLLHTLEMTQRAHVEHYRQLKSLMNQKREEATISAAHLESADDRGQRLQD